MNNIMKVGDKTLAFCETFLLSDHETGTIDVPLGAETLAVSIRFEPTKGEASARWSFENNVLKPSVRS